jgi:hypothetical protein
VFTGDKHHERMKRIGGARWESLTCITPPDAWANGMAFVTRPAMQRITYHKAFGEVQRVTHSL